MKFYDTHRRYLTRIRKAVEQQFSGSRAVCLSQCDAANRLNLTRSIFQGGQHYSPMETICLGTHFPTIYLRCTTLTSDNSRIIIVNQLIAGLVLLH